MPEQMRPLDDNVKISPEELGTMEEMRKIAYKWLAAFNKKKLKNLLNLYAPDAVHYSPRLLTLEPDTGGKIQGREAMRDWWGDAFQRMPRLSYLPMGVETRGDEVILTYDRKEDDNLPTSVVREILKIKNGKIVESRVL